MLLAGRPPAQVYALVVGAVLVVVGIAGFFWGSSFAIGTSAGVEQGFVLGIVAVNGWLNLLHVATGAIGLAVARSYAAARTYALAIGVGYLAVGVLGFVAAPNDAVVGLIAVNAAGNLLHLVLAVAGIGAGLTTPEEPAASTATG